MNIILLSGGSGKRLWPLSNDIRSKQFLKLFAAPGGGRESMVQRMYRQVRAADPGATVTVATSRSQVSALRNQLGTGIGISVEPCRRDTFPAIALATAYLHDVRGVGMDEPVVVCPVDPYVDEGYFAALGRLGELAGEGVAGLVLMGIDPTYPSEKYGYILPEGKGEVSRVREFKEKPDAATAQGYIDAGGLWNGGVFAYKLGHVLGRAHELIDFEDYQDLFDRYDRLEKISFDYAVVEHEPSIAVLRHAGEWKDLGTWNALTEEMASPSIGNVRTDDACVGVHVVNELDVPVVAMGLTDVVIAASPEGVLVADKARTDLLKPIVDEMHQQLMFAEKSWGSYRVIDVGEDSLTIKVTLNPGHAMNYHSHEHRDERWTVLRGSGTVIVDGVERQVGPGDVVSMPAGCKHTVRAVTELQMIEVQLGRDITVTDKHKHEL